MGQGISTSVQGSGGEVAKHTFIKIVKRNTSNVVAIFEFIIFISSIGFKFTKSQS